MQSLDLRPKKEPLIKVGLILPEDKTEHLMVKLSNPSLYEIRTNERNYPSIQSRKNLHLSLINNKIRINDLKIQLNNITISNMSKDNDGSITINNLIAGRGFHWEKKISRSFWGSINIKCIDSRLVVINEILLEKYLACVSTSEMSAKCPSEFLKTQTIIARSWLLANHEKKHSSLGIDVCNDDCCQRYQGNDNISEHSIHSANSTRGVVIIHENKICDTRYSKSCGGITEDYENVWQGSLVPYLSSINDINSDQVPFCSSKIINEKKLKNYIGNVDETEKYFRWEKRVNESEIIELLENKQNEKIDHIVELKPLKIGKSKRIINLQISYLLKDKNKKSIIIDSEYQIRKILSKSFLFSSAIKIDKVKNEFIFKGRGWGHGVGLCQIGALGMAFSNYDSSEILAHYYKKSKIYRLYK